jgi:hypothetical protein
MKWRSLSILFCLVFVGLFSGCSGGNQRGTTPVTVIVGAGKTSQNALSRSALHSKATPTVVSVTFTITGPGMDAIVRVVPVTPPQTITEVFSILSGPSRNFLIEAKDGSGTVIYSGGILANLDGEPLTLTLPLQTLIFNQMIWTPWDDEATSITKAQDGSGNLVIAGHTFGNLGGPNADPTHNTPDVFVTKLTSSGSAVWTRQFGSNGFEICYSVATDSAGNVYVAGSTDGNLDPAGQGLTKTGVVDAFVTKLSPTGSVLWTRLTGTAGYYAWGNTVTVDDAGNVYLAGSTDGGLVSIQTGTAFVNQDPTNAPNRKTNTYDVFIVKFDTNGLPQWTQQFGTPADDTGDGIAFSPAISGPSAVVVIGSTDGNLGGTNSGFSDLYVAKFDTTGVLQWKQQLGSSDYDNAWGIAIDQGTGAIYVAGGTYGNLDVYTNADPSGNTEDLFVVKYDAYGIKQWTRQLGSADNDVATGIAFDPNYGVVVTGRTSGNLDQLGNAGLDDMFLVEFDANGNSGPIRQLGTKADDWGMGVVIDGSGKISVVGNTTGGFTSSSTEDAFLQLFDWVSIIPS